MTEEERQAFLEAMISGFRNVMQEFVSQLQQKPEEKPGEKPEEKPGEKPEEKPGEKPEEKPGEKPEEKPGEKPEEKPGEQIEYAPETGNEDDIDKFLDSEDSMTGRMLRSYGMIKEEK